MLKFEIIFFVMQLFSEVDGWLLLHNMQTSHPSISRRVSNLLKKEMFVYRGVLCVSNGAGANHTLLPP